MSVLVIVPTHLSVSGECGVSPGSPRAGDRGGHRLGGGDRGGGFPLPAGGGTRRSLLVAPTPPGLRPPPPPPQGAGAVRGDTQGQTLPGHDELPVRTGRALADKDQDRFPRRWWTIDRRPTNSARKRRSSPELDGILTSLPTERSRVWGPPPPPLKGSRARVRWQRGRLAAGEQV
ncbi:hypothetical protein MBBA_1653 [Methanoculleus bourgensis]|jgi:hypothetical protein|nr:hypothetical protein MBBA_1653 [Methanoculleus bourgensis]